MELVSVEYEYQYKAKDGHIISIKPQETYILVCKTNEHWWRVRKDQNTKPFYIPANYVKELSAPTTDSTATNNSSESNIKSKPSICTSPAPSREKYRFSTFGFCENSPHVKSWEPVKGTATRNVSLTDTPNTAQTHNSKPAAALISAPAKADSPDEEPKPQPAENPAQLKEPRDHASKEQTFPEDYDMDFPLPPPDMIPDIEITESNNFPEQETLVPEESIGLQSSIQNTDAAPLTDSQYSHLRAVFYHEAQIFSFSTQTEQGRLLILMNYNKV
ncbi:hypothetical protein OJAV_G00192820 [Oryzias javanicus]|uniref:SH3 domain-containing protein n=1 Tax=Oryzias javanicus TaxID=123683 RepID=A0A437CCD1_ORYJA|nr:hypothetical protein OJAV_G00192820 [Oryzias javanicus]